MPRPNAEDFPHSLNAVHHVGVNIAHPAANFRAKTFGPFVSEVRTHGYCNEKWSQYYAAIGQDITRSATSSPLGIRIATIIGDTA